VSSWLLTRIKQTDLFMFVTPSTIRHWLV